MADLTEVFHSIYDLKDEHIENEPIRVACYKALVYVEQLMEATGVEIPNRHDGDGRPRNVMLTDEYLQARGVVQGTEPAEDVIRRIRDGVPGQCEHLFPADGEEPCRCDLGEGHTIPHSCPHLRGEL